LTQLVNLSGELSGVIFTEHCFFHCLLMARCRGGDLMR